MADPTQLYRGDTMTGFEVKGWCPDALRPMESGDGWIVRVSPPHGRLSAAQTLGLAKAAADFGNGLLDLTSRANIQIRGVSPATHPPLVAALQELDLIGPAAMFSPFDDAPDLPPLPPLPNKFGIAVDIGPVRWLANASADIRLERGISGRIILRADGAALGLPNSDIRRMVEWAAKNKGRMAAHHADLPPDLRGTEAPVPAMPVPQVGPTLVAAAFGQITAETFAKLGPVRLTPWRMLLVQTPPPPEMISDPADPRLRVTACTGAPACAQGLQPTKPLAHLFAAHVPQGETLHISGCAKGCARPAPAWMTLVGTPRGYAAIPDGTARDKPRFHIRLTPDTARDDTAAPNHRRSDAPQL